MRILTLILAVFFFGCEFQAPIILRNDLETCLKNIVLEYTANEQTNNLNLILSPEATFYCDDNLKSFFRSTNDMKTVYPAFMVELELVEELSNNKQKYILTVGYLYGGEDGSGDIYDIHVIDGKVIKCQKTGRWIS